MIKINFFNAFCITLIYKIKKRYGSKVRKIFNLFQFFFSDLSIKQT